MSATFIKICGITRPDDGLAALEAGADALGFIRVPGTPRFRLLTECVRLIQSIRERAGRDFEAVGVYVDPDPDAIAHEIEAAGFDRVQLHGAEPLSLIQALGVPAIKTIKISDASSLDRAEEYPGVDLLADTADPRLHGGTGRGYDASLLAPLVSRRRVIVAGGLHPGNVAGIVRHLHPYGVDVSSGVESAPGVKDPAKIRAFIQAVRQADPAVGDHV